MDGVAMDVIQERQREGERVIILAIDPARIMGYAIYATEGNAFLRASHVDLGDRPYGKMANTMGWLFSMLSLSGPNPIIAIEDPGEWTRGSKKSKLETIVAMARFQGAILALGEGQGFQVRIKTVNAVRALIVPEALGQRRTQAKAAVIRNLELRGHKVPVLSNGKKDDNAADAMCLALAIAADLKIENAEVWKWI